MIEDDVALHYRRGGLAQSLLEALAAAGKDIDRLAPEDLASFDEFHIRGREATAELAGDLGLTERMSVVDVGSGLGGPSRHLAHGWGCHVTGIDLSSDYVEAATELSRRTGLADRVTYRQGSALAMPFADASFDAAITQHVAMNIADKAALYREVHRVLKPGARFAIYDVMKGPDGEPHFPVPWATTPATSFLATPDEVAAALEAAGFTIEARRERTAEGRAWFEAMRERVARDGVPPLGLHLVMGKAFAEMGGNVLRNLVEGRIVLVEMLARRD